jgi:hypothetical protein
MCIMSAVQYPVIPRFGVKIVVPSVAVILLTACGLSYIVAQSALLSVIRPFLHALHLSSDDGPTTPQ